MAPLPVLYFLLFILPLILLYRIRTRSLVSKQNPLPSPPRIPIIGNLHQIGHLPHRSLLALSNKHGPLMLLHLGRVPTLIVSSAEAAREIMKTHDLIFASRPHSNIADTVLYGSTNIAFSPYGEYWRNLRKLCTTHLLSTKMVQSFRQSREEEVALMMDKISSRATSSVVDMSEVLNTFANDMLCRVVSGKFSSETRNKVVKGLKEEVSALFGAFHVEDFIPYMGWVDVFFGLNRRAKRNRKGWDDLLDEVIEEHANRRGGDDVDFVHILLSLQKDPNMDFRLTKDNIKAVLLDMLFAGTDASYIVLEWAMAELVRNSEVMKKLQNEVRGIISRRSKIQEEDLSQMRYLKCVLKEVLRLHPVAPLLLPRESMENCQIQGYIIPKKTRVIINAWAINRDPKFWEASEEFRPERFDGSPIDLKGNDFQFIPFGAGRRICPGMNFALATTELALANLVNYFNWELPDGMTSETLDMTETPGVTVHMNKKLRLIAKPYYH